MKALAPFFFSIACLGLAAVLVIHVAALAGNLIPFELLEPYLFPALAVVWIPMIFLMNQMNRVFAQEDVWKAALRGAPPWVYRSLFVLWGYAVITFAITTFAANPHSQASGAVSVSAVMMGFWGVGCAVMYSAMHIDEVDQNTRCINGHPVLPLAKFCEECGAPVQPNT